MSYSEKWCKDQEIIEACSTSNSMDEAASKVNLNKKTFKKRAIKLGVYSPNQGGRGSKKPKQEGRGKFSLKDILEGKHPQYQTFKLKNLILAEGVLPNECAWCGISEWRGKEIPLELDHIDGNCTNHLLDNLRILCPNCHSQTDTHRAKNKNRRYA